jgi:hypothetical protein
MNLQKQGGIFLSGMSFYKKMFAFFQGLLQKGVGGGELRVHEARPMNFMTIIDRKLSMFEK